MKFTTKNQSNQKTPKAYLVQGSSQQYVAFVNDNYLHTLTPSGGGLTEYMYAESAFQVGDFTRGKEKVIQVFYEGDTLEITF